MKKIALRLLLALGALVLGIVVVASFRPDTYSVSRSIVVNAPAATVWPWVSQLKKNQEWSPWGDEDPDMKVTYSGTDGTVGASSAWDAKHAGTGHEHITALEENKRVDFHLVFLKPFEDESDASLSLAPAGAGTKVTWEMRGHSNLVGKIMCLFMSMDSMIGKPFETGLSRLKAKVESAAPAALPAATPAP